MNEDEKTRLRIAAAKAVGWRIETEERKWDEVTEYPHRLISPESIVHWQTGRPIEDVEAGLCRLFNPLDNPDDCEALLVAVLQLARRHYWSFTVRQGVTCWQAIFYVDESSVAEGRSSNSDASAAYREAVVKACVAAWQAEKGGGE